MTEDEIQGFIQRSNDKRATILQLEMDLVDIIAMPVSESLKTAARELLSHIRLLMKAS